MTEEQLKNQRLAQLETQLNAGIDKDLAAQGDDLLWPKAAYYIVPNEFGERFGFYGSKPLFTRYLSRFYGLKITDVTVRYDLCVRPIWQTCQLTFGLLNVRYLLHCLHFRNYTLTSDLDINV